MIRQAEIAAEARLRAAELPTEIARWETLSGNNTDGLGIHKSQIAAIGLLFDSMAAAQQTAVDALVPTAAPDDFANQRLVVETKLTTAHTLMEVFRYILQQRSAAADGKANLALDAADLICARFYRDALDTARKAGILSDEQFREPPLCYWNGSMSPAAFTRRHTLGAFEFRFNEEATAKLPISIISLPAHFANAIWTYCTLCHEIGHLLDQDLGLRSALTTDFQSAVSKATWDSNWLMWQREVIADTFGILFGGAEFARTLAKLLYLPKDRMITQNPDDLHPTPYLRLFLNISLLRTAFPNSESAKLAADDLENEAVGRCGKSETLPALSTLVAECDAVARVMLTTKPDVLKGLSLSAFALPDSHQADVDALTRFLRIGAMRPDPSNFSMALLPLAAQRAVVNIADDDSDFAGHCGKVQERALAFSADIPRPQFLADPFSVAFGDTERRKLWLRSQADSAIDLLDNLEDS